MVAKFSNTAGTLVAACLEVQTVCFFRERFNVVKLSVPGDGDMCCSQKLASVRESSQSLNKAARGFLQKVHRKKMACFMQF